MQTTYDLPKEFETLRYRLRAVAQSDAAAIFQSYATDTTVTRHLGWRPHRDERETAGFIGSVIGEWDTRNGFPLVVFPRSNPSDLIGMIHPHVRGFKINYGYVLAQRAWGQGCATEILGWLVEHALAHSAIHRAEAFCDVENAPSARVMEKVGMVREGCLRRYFVHPNMSETPRDCFMYARVR